MRPSGTADSCNEGTDSCDHEALVPDDLVLDDTTLTSGEFTARISIIGGPNLVIDGPVRFISGETIIFTNDATIGDGFSAEILPDPCP